MGRKRKGRCGPKRTNGEPKKLKGADADFDGYVGDEQKTNENFLRYYKVIECDEVVYNQRRFSCHSRAQCISFRAETTNRARFRMGLV